MRTVTASEAKQGLAVELVCLRGHPSDLRPEFESLGVPIHTLELGNGFGRYLRLIWLSFCLCRQLRPSAVLSFPLGWHACIGIGARFAGVQRFSAHVGNLPPVWTGNAFRKFRILVQLGRPFTQRLLCCSEYIRTATVRDFGLHSRETRTIYNACDLDNFVTFNRSVNGHHPPRLVMVARLEAHKDHPTLIRAVAELRIQGLKVELWLIGEGSHRIRLEALIKELQLNDQVFLLGSRRDIPALLCQIDLFVFAARPDEGFGIALAEAMAAGVPIVATDVGACREVLDGGRCGLLVEPYSPVALAAGIRHALTDAESALQRANAARQRALSDFSVPAMAAAYAQQLGLCEACVSPTRSQYP